MYKNLTKVKSQKVQSCHNNNLSEITAVEKHFPVITLLGQPNSGKTTLFNTLTGSNFKTSNYPGATVEYSVGRLVSKYNFNTFILDSPGIISLTPSSPDEDVTIDALFNHPKFGVSDVIIVTADVTQLSRQLFLVKQVIDAGFKTVVALTMNDLLDKKDFTISPEKLSGILNVPVVKIDGRRSEGIAQLVENVEALFRETFIDSTSEDYKKKIHKPSIPTEKFVAEQYDFTEDTENKVISRKNLKPDIDSINRKVFQSLHRTPDKNSLKLDKVFLHPFWGMIIFILSMGIIFTSIFWLAKPVMNLIDSGFSNLSAFVASILPQSAWYSDLLTKGIISGFGSVMVFLPQIVILFIFLGILEDTGYLSRAAMLIDKPLSKFGLNGRSFVPMLSGYACAIPAMMAARTITNRRERFLTIMIIPLMSCSARLPVYALLLAFLVPADKTWIAGLSLGALYFFSLVSGSVVAGVISKFKKTDEKSTFMLELPSYRKPVLKHILKNTYYKSGMYIKKAGPTIVFISLILWALTYFPDINPDLDSNITKGMTVDQLTRLVQSERLSHSYAAKIGNIFQPVLKPLGWDWRIGVSLISAFAAREVFVSAMAITFKITDADNEENMQASLLSSMKEAKQMETGKPLFTTASTVALIIYFMFAMQCLSTVVVARRETGSWKIPVFQIVLYTWMAYILAFITYNGLNFLGIS